MNESTTSAARTEYPRVVLGIAAFEVVAVPIAAVLLAVLELVDPLIFLLTSLVRIAVWVGHWRLLWTPIAAGLGETGDELPSQQQLLTADAALSRLPEHFAAVYGLGWLVSIMLDGCLSMFGLPVEMPVGPAEIMALLWVGIALWLGVAVMMVATLKQATKRERVAVAMALLERRIDPRRREVSLGLRVAIGGALLVLASWLGAVGSGGMLRVEALRAAQLSEHQRRAQLSAQGFDLAEAPLFEGLQTVRQLQPDNLPVPLERALAAQPGATTLAVHDAPHGEVLTAALRSDGQWAVSIGTVDEQLERWTGLVAVSCLLFTPLLAFILFVFSRAIWAPAEHLSELARRVVEEGDLSKLERVVPLANDEFGRLIRYFSGLLNMLEQLSQSASKVANGDLSVQLDHPGELHDAFRAMVAHLSEMVTRIRETSLELASSAARIHRISDRRVESAKQQSHSVNQVRQTVESLAGSAQDIAATATTVLSDAQQTVDTTDAMVNEINLLSEQAASVGQLLEVIREIAKRSDLLALNGSLEATRAGEAGRGFALVALEMRRLAERVTGTVSDVDARIGSIRAASTSTVLVTQTSREVAQRTARAAQTISEVTSSQGTDTEQVLREVTAVAAMVHDAHSAISQTQAAAEGLRRHAAELERLTGRFKLVRSRHESPDSESSEVSGPTPMASKH